MELLVKPVSEKDIPIAKVVGGDADETIIYLHSIKCCSNCSKNCIVKREKCCKECRGGSDDVLGDQKITLESGIFQVLPNDEQSERIYLFGKPQCGKSHWSYQFACEYQTIYPDRPVYLISYVYCKSAVNDIPNVIHIPITDIMEGQVTEKTIPDSLVIFDDVDEAPLEDVQDWSRKEIFEKIQHLRDVILTRGSSHNNITILTTAHVGRDHKKSKAALNNHSALVVFPNAGNHSHIHDILTKTNGFTEKQYKEITASKKFSRWIFVNNIPQYVVNEKEVFIPQSD